jgi:hypothetical protein
VVKLQVSALCDFLSMINVSGQISDVQPARDSDAPALHHAAEATPRRNASNAKMNFPNLLHVS